jgi:hypothetical protein
MLKPTKLSRKEKANSEYAGPDSPKLSTKKAGMLKTAADQPRELMKHKEEPAKKKAGIKGLISNAMNKAKSYAYT